MKEVVEVLVSEEEIKERINCLADKINAKYKDKTLILVCVLKGGVIFMVDLAKKLKGDIRFDFMDISSYGDGTVSSGNIKINKDLENSIENEHVLLVEDIVDSGRTLRHLLKHMEGQNPKSIEVCSLLDKPDRREYKDIAPDYTGFIIPNEFVVGYGLDYAQKYRNLPYIGVLHFEE